MSQKFISLDDAAEKLGVSKDQLNQLREAGDLRAYRDGASWKFRTEEIDKLEAEGMPTGEVDDDLTLDAGAPLEIGGLDDDDDNPPTPGLEPLEPLGDDTDKPAEEAASTEDDDEDIGLAIEPLGDGDDAESILLTGDDELEGGLPRPQSTIIGKSELSLEDDLQLAAGSDLGPPPAPAEKPAGDKTDSPGSAFDNLEELELDLEAESSRILEAKDVEKAKKAAEESGELQLESDLELDLAGSAVSNDASSSDIMGDKSELDLAGSISGISGADEIDLSDDEDDDLVLGGSDDGGLAAGDSGINLSPSDSGFALDEVPLDLGGSAIGSALDLAALSAAGSAASGLSGLGSGVSSDSPAEDFQLTPGDDGEEDEEDSSQIVALEEVSEEDEDLPGFEPVDDGDDDLEGGFDGGMAAEPVGAPAGAVAAQEIPFPGWVVGLLGAGFFSMLLCGILAMDLVQSMWAWDEPFSVNSAIMDGILGLFGG
ncbi:MAG: helix-turn-helix domain-containing protein [Planctomycetota bacterium]